MADYRGIFSLQQLYEEQQSDNWAIAEESSFTKPPYSIDWQYGYFSGGDINPGSTSTVDRVDYSNDLNITSRRGNLSQARFGGGGTGNKNYGWNAGGYTPPSYLSTTDRIDYSNDTATAAPKGPLTSNKNTIAAVGNENYGYWSGGYSPSNSPVRISTVDRIDYSNDTPTASPKGPLSQARTSHAGTGTLSYGYFGGGDLPGSSSRVDRIDYSNDTATASTKGDLAQAAYNVGAVGNNNYGYWTGGYNPPSYLSSVSRLDYASDSTACVTRGPLTTNKNNTTGVSNSSYGWLGGGYNPSVRSDVDRIDFANDTSTASPRGSLSIPKFSVGGSSAKSNTIPGTTSIANQGVGITTTGTSVNTENPSQFNYGGWGYFAGGYDIPPRRSSVERIDLSNDTVNATQRANMSAIKQSQVGSSSLTHGYATGGYDGANNVTSVFKIDFSNDTSTPVTAGPFSRAVSTTQATHTSDYSWTLGGGSPSVSTVDRVDFSNDSATSLVRGKLTIARQAQMTSGNLNYGYSAGGYFSSPITRHSNVDRIEYANDTATATPKANLLEIRQSGSSVGNYHYGYWAGGYDGSNNKTSVYRFDYSNDNAQVTPRGNIIGQKTAMGAFSNHTYGYFGGGYDQSTAESSLVQRVDFANDTADYLTRGFLVETRATSSGHHSGNMVNFKPPAQINDFKGPLAVANTAQQYGYAAQVGGVNTTIQRINFANDTNNAVTTGPLTDGRVLVGGTSSQTHGYFFGGFKSGPTYYSTIDRIVYANDTNTASARAFMGTPRYSATGTANVSYAWLAGGSPGTISTIERIDFANDDTTPSTRGPLLNARYSLASTGNQNYGYFSGGAALTSVTDRVDYSNDTPTASPKGTLSAARTYFSAAANNNYGWFGGGTPGPAPNRVSTVDRIDFSNDTATASPKGPLERTTYQTASVGNVSYGYWIGGQPGYSTVYRIDYANDTSIAESRSFLTGTNYFGNSGASAANYGAPGQGS
jgi:hypothetical protein